MSGYKINVLSHGREIEVCSKAPLLTTLIEHSIIIRSDCGGRGVCNKCVVDVSTEKHEPVTKLSCQYIVDQDIDITIPQTSLQSPNILRKKTTSLPKHFKRRIKTNHKAEPIYGIAVDLGTTTIALYLCDITQGTILTSSSVKNPQSLYGDDVMSRISSIAEDEKKLNLLQKLVIKTIEWGCKNLSETQGMKLEKISKMMVVGNPTMIHIFLGVDPHPIGVAPYEPAFHEAKCVPGAQIGFKELHLVVNTLPLISGFIGADILAAIIAADLITQPKGTLIVDIGTNGELVYKGEKGIYATSCATGPAFEGASISCGIQATHGAIEDVTLANRYDNPKISIITTNNDINTSPTGLCGSGVISATAELYRTGVIKSNGAFIEDEAIGNLVKTSSGKKFIISSNHDGKVTNQVAISQKDIRAIQLGKGALITGIEFLLKEEHASVPGEIIIAGAFGSYLKKEDMIALGMLPQVKLQQIINSGNLAGAGAIMALCDESYLEEAKQLAAKIQVVDLASSIEFQKVFIDRLSFPIISP